MIGTDRDGRMFGAQDREMQMGVRAIEEEKRGPGEFKPGEEHKPQGLQVGVDGIQGKGKKKGGTISFRYVLACSLEKQTQAGSLMTN